jgi:hypothetical protein
MMFQPPSTSMAAPNTLGRVYPRLSSSVQADRLLRPPTRPPTKSPATCVPQARGGRGRQGRGKNEPRRFFPRTVAYTVRNSLLILLQHGTLIPPFPVPFQSLFLRTVSGFSRFKVRRALALGGANGSSRPVTGATGTLLGNATGLFAPVP